MRPTRLMPANHWSETPLAKILLPLRRFLHEARAGGIILFAATAVALVLANSSLHPQFEALLHTELGFRLGHMEFSHSLLHWVNDGLMTIYFFVVGLEIKREFSTGELANPRAALLPILAATGGATVPALIYMFFNHGAPSHHGWAVPMATDIAFTLGALSLLGTRVPVTLKIFLTAVAIVDDLIAVLVIACFYSGSLNWAALTLGLALLTLALFANFCGVRNLGIYGGLTFLIWAAFLKSGVHATVAGVLSAWCLPARTIIDPDTFRAQVQELMQNSGPEEQIFAGTVQEIERLCEAVQAPLQRAEHMLGQAAALVIIPIFALANAGVPLSRDIFGPQSAPIAWGIILGLVLGKPLGILLTCACATKLGMADLPGRTSWAQMLGGSVLAGIGFTMSIFIASLAFPDPTTLAATKGAILVASFLAFCGGVLLLYLVRPQTT